jgi:preprotein translocase subunit SecA
MSSVIQKIQFKQWLTILVSKSNEMNTILSKHSDPIEKINYNSLKLLIFRLINNEELCNKCGHANLQEVYKFLSEKNKWKIITDQMIKEQKIKDNKRELTKDEIDAIEKDTKDQIVQFYNEKNIPYKTIRDSMQLLLNFKNIPTYINNLVKKEIDKTFPKIKELETKDLIDSLESETSPGVPPSLTHEEAIKLQNQLKAIEQYTSCTRENDSKDEKYNYTEKTRIPADIFPDKNDEELVKEVARVSAIAHQTTGRYPRKNQLIAILEFLDGRNTLLQVGTGQGKSLIVGMTAVLQKKLKRPVIPGDNRPMAVHIITVTDDLVKDAIDSNKPLFDACGVYARSLKDPLRADDDIIYDRSDNFNQRAGEELQEPIASRKLLIPHKVRRTVIVDESDNKLVDNPEDRLYFTNDDPDEKQIKKVYSDIIYPAVIAYYKDDYPINNNLYIPNEFHTNLLIKKIDESNMIDPSFQDRWNLEKKPWVRSALEVFNTPSMYQEGRDYIARIPLSKEIEFFKKHSFKFSGNIDNYKFLSLYLISGELRDLKERLDLWFTSINNEDLRKLVISQYYKSLDLINDIDKWAKFGYKKNADQLLYKGQIQYLDVKTGQILAQMEFQDGVQEFLEFKHFKEIFHDPKLSFRSYSLYRYIRESDILLGLSGTVGNDNLLYNFQKKVWRVDRPPIIIPNFAKSQLVPKTPAKQTLGDETGWYETIYDAVIDYKKEQPILIITESPAKARKLLEKLESKGINSAKYEESSDLHLLDELLIPGDIIISTNLGGRGSDYKFDPTKSAKGLHAIIGFDSNEERILAQARGRAGRAGNPGSWQIIAYGEQLQQKPELERNKCDLIKRESLGYDSIYEIYLYFKDKLSAKTLERVTAWLSNYEVKNDIIDKLLNNQDLSIDKKIEEAKFNSWYSIKPLSDYSNFIEPPALKAEITAIRNARKISFDIQSISNYILETSNALTAHKLINYNNIIELCLKLCPHFEEVLRLESCIR